MNTIPQSLLDLIKTRQFAPDDGERLQLFDRVFAPEDGKRASNPACYRYIRKACAERRRIGNAE